MAYAAQDELSQKVGAMMQDESESLPEALMSKSSCSPFFSPQLQFPFCLFSRWFETKSSLSFA